jgi:hypothetical protein
VDIDPMESIEPEEDEAAPKPPPQAAKLNMWVAITVALLATFTGICKVKDDNIVQAMQQAQADRIDHWSFYQARHLRQELAEATLADLRGAQARARAAERASLAPAVARYETLAKEQASRKDSLRLAAFDDQKRYDALNYRDDQFDLSDTLIALAISMLALTALTHQRWLYWAAMVPTGLGLLMGLAGLLRWPIHPDAIARLLS